MLYLILLLPLAMAALSLIRNDRARTVILPWARPCCLRC